MHTELKKCDYTIVRLGAKAAELNADFSIEFKESEFIGQMRNILNENIKVVYPGFENGIYNIDEEGVMMKKQSEMSMQLEESGMINSRFDEII